MDSLEEQLAHAQYQISGYQKELYEVEQNLGVALGYPRYADDKQNFPNASENDGVCIGVHTPASIAMEAAQKIMALIAEAKEIQENSIHKSVFDTLTAEFIKAKEAQISINDLEYPPRALQGAPIHQDLLNLLTADDVNRFIFEIGKLNEQIALLKFQLLKANIQRIGANANLDAVEQACLENLNEDLEDIKVLKQHVIARERIAYRALQMIINNRNSPITAQDCARAETMLATLIESNTEKERYVQAISEGLYQTRLNYDNGTLPQPDPE